MPTATPAFTSFARRSSLALSLSSLMRGFLWPSAPLWKPHERAEQASARAEGRAVAGGSPGRSRRSVGLRREREDAGPDRARASPAAAGCTTRIDPLHDV